MVGLVIADHCSEQTFQSVNGAAYRNGKPYRTPGSLSNEAFRNIWNIPLATNGWFINYESGEFPKVDFNVLLVVSEIKSRPSVIRHLRQLYPNAQIVGYVKESHPFLTHRPWEAVSSFLKECDKIALPYRKKIIDYCSEQLDQEIWPVHFPYNVDLIRKMFKREETNKCIFIGCNSWDASRGYAECLEFTKKISKRINVEYLENTGSYTWDKWLEEIARCQFCINMDKQPRLGQVPIECAIIGTPHIGGMADAANTLWPDTATNDPKILAEIIISGEFKIEQAKRLVVERHSFKTVKKQIEDLM